MVVLDQSHRGDPALQQSLSGLTQTRLSEDGTLFIATLAAHDLTLNLPPDETVPDRVAGALLNMGARLAQEGQFEEALAHYDELVMRFRDATAPAVRVLVARALYNTGVTLGRLGRSRDAAAAVDRLVSGFDAAPEPAIRELVAIALRTRSEISGAPGDRH